MQPTFHQALKGRSKNGAWRKKLGISIDKLTLKPSMTEVKWQVSMEHRFGAGLRERFATGKPAAVRFALRSFKINHSREYLTSGGNDLTPFPLSLK
jgi:hypothetical protein